jgi:c(7)-type cytochrome triheme protein
MLAGGLTVADNGNPGAHQAVAGHGWVPLAEDGIHDPSGPAIHELQEPGDVLSRLPGPPSVWGSGNQIRWVEALESGAISPRRARVLPEPKVPVLDMDVLLDLRGSMRVVRFPHKAHTEWLACENCHDEIFKPRIGANGIAMFNILNGEQCGRCHGAVSFPIIRQCVVCHSVKRPEEKETNGGERFVP